MSSLKKKMLISISFSLFHKIEEFPKIQNKKNLTTKKFSQPVFADTALSYVNSLQELNQTEIYLIVSKSKKKNHLLLLHGQEQLSAHPGAKPKRFRTVYLKGRQKKYHREGWYHFKTREVYRGFSLRRMLKNSIVTRYWMHQHNYQVYDKRFRAQELKNKEVKNSNDKVDLSFEKFRVDYAESPLHEYYRGGNFYFPDNLNGGKSICPVFFDQESAKLFLTSVCEDSIEVLRHLPLYTKEQVLAKKQLSKKIVETKIISIGLGDFLNFYSNPSHEDALQKTEFLFIPSFEELETKPTKQKAMDTLHFYQQHVFAHKSKT